MSATDPLRAVILAVGSEMLTPWRVDSNSLFVTEVLNGIGIDVVAKAVVGDDRGELTAQVAHALERHDVLILTGGLGPTDDDLTREAVAAYLDLPLDEDPAIVASMRARFEARGWRMPEVNLRQAMVPRGATVLANPNGTAPGLLIETRGKIIALLPGPPREMKPMMSGPVRERLVPRAAGLHLLRRMIRVAGRTESRVEELTQPIYSTWLSATPPIETTILATPGLIELHVSTRVRDEAAGAAALEDAIGQFVAVLGDDVVSRDGRGLEETVGRLLRERGWRIALAESCTGGLASSKLTDVPGSSDYVDRSVVVYSNASKIALLGVPDALIAEYGAVSEAVAVAMAEGMRRSAGVEVGVGITGIAGPGGGTETKPVGTVCIAVAAGGETKVRTYRFLGGRDTVKTFASITAIDQVRRALIGGKPDVDWVRRP